MVNNTRVIAFMYIHKKCFLTLQIKCLCDILIFLYYTPSAWICMHSKCLQSWKTLWQSVLGGAIFCRGFTLSMPNKGKKMLGYFRMRSCSHYTDHCIPFNSTQNFSLCSEYMYYQLFCDFFIRRLTKNA